MNASIVIDCQDIGGRRASLILEQEGLNNPTILTIRTWEGGLQKETLSVLVPCGELSSAIAAARMVLVTMPTVVKT